MSLPGFKRGGSLTAEALNRLAARVRELQGKAPGVAMASRARTVRFVPGRQYGFRLAVWNGLVWVRQGWVDAGNGHLYSVGDQEWNDLGPVRGMTVWLELSETEGRVVVTEYDDSTPETNLRRRLGYVREETPDGEETPTLHCVQLLGGLVVPAAPRRVMGMNNHTEEFGKGDHCWDWVRAGNLRGVDFEEIPGRYYPGASVSFAYMVDVRGVQLAAKEGGNRLMQTMSLGGGG